MTIELRSRPDRTRRVAWRAMATAAVAVVALASVARSEPAAAEGEVSVCAEGVAEARARKVQTRYDGIRDLAARFEQRSESATFAGSP